MWTAAWQAQMNVKIVSLCGFSDPAASGVLATPALTSFNSDPPRSDFHQIFVYTHVQARVTFATEGNTPVIIDAESQMDC